MLSNILRRFYYIVKSPVAYARFLGVKIGDNCLIGTRNWGSEPYLITIGNNVQVTQDVYFHTHGGAHVARKIYPNFDVFGKIVIKDWVYIGSGSHLMPGITIGEGSLIAAASIVTKSVPAGEVWGGAPAKFICKVEEYIAKNISYNVDSKYMTQKQKKLYLLSLPSTKFLVK